MCEVTLLVYYCRFFWTKTKVFFCSKCLPRADPVRACITLASAVMSVQKLIAMPLDSPQRHKFLPERRRWLEEAKTCLSLTFGEDHPLYSQAQMALTLFPKQ